MNISIAGLGAVSPAGWGVKSLREALAAQAPLLPTDLARPGWEKPLRVRSVPASAARLAVLAHPRLRRISAITRYAVAAAAEALGGDLADVSHPQRLGVIFCVMSGCVNYSRRFYDEVLKDPPSASPLVFPETVFNAPSSHLAALLGASGLNYTLVGDPGTFLQGLALGADWLLRERADRVLVVGAEEIDWATADSFRMFSRRLVLAEGAGAVVLSRGGDAPALASLEAITDSHLFLHRRDRAAAAAAMRQQLPARVADGALLCDGLQNVPRFDAGEAPVWRDWTGPRLSPKTVLGEGLMAAAAWQCVAALDALSEGRASAANVSVVGCNQQAIGAQFLRASANFP